MPLSPFALLDRFRFPAPDGRRVSFLARVPYAHRGLHGTRLVENSRAAIMAAAEAGYGVELDVQFTLDGAAFVFHDETLDRLTEATGKLKHMTTRDLAQIKLNGTDETIPKLDEILRLINGRVPVLIELKAVEGHVSQLCVAVRHALESYRGEAAVMSMHGEVPRWFAAHGTRVVRGLIMSDNSEYARERPAEQLKAIFRSKPEFLAIDVNDLPSRLAARLRKRGIPVLTWTVRTAEQQALAAENADQIIFEAPGW
jgi:glycerophosphoryl diester phosphodiesterase